MDDAQTPTHVQSTMSARAKDFAIHAHGDQKYGQHPYSIHLASVAAIASEFGAPATVCEAAWLHDVLEDTEASFEELEAHFGRDVATLVDAVTNKPGATRAESHALTYPALRDAGPHAVLLKLCDRLANVRASTRTSPKKLAMYQQEFASFHATLYLEGEHDELWAALEALLRP